MWSNLHTHSTYCDGKTGLDEIFDAAEKLELRSIGFSSHAPLPFERPWAMRRETQHQYLREIAALKNRDSAVQVYAGLEIDYVPGLISPVDFVNQLDYTIGSVHFVDQFPDGNHWEIDNTAQVFKDGLQQIFGGKIRDAVSRYFELTREMIERYTPSIAGHIDKIKMHNLNGVYFREDEPWYVQEISKTIDALAGREVVIEINTRGIYQKKTDTTYPSPWIVEMLKKRDVRVTISSDAHHPKDLVNGFDAAAAMLIRAGYREIQVLHDGNWKAYRLDHNGIC